MSKVEATQTIDRIKEHFPEPIFCSFLLDADGGRFRGLWPILLCALTLGSFYLVVMGSLKEGGSVGRGTLGTVGS